MKGLLLKDWYMTKKYCKNFLFLIGMAAVASLFLWEEMGAFFLTFSAVMAGMAPITLLAYDETERWLEYSGTLPYTRSQLVTAKYLMGLFFVAGAAALLLAVQGLRMAIAGESDFSELRLTALLMLTMGILYPALSLPFMFRLGTAKGRVFSIVVMGMLYGASMLVVLDQTEEAAGFPVEEAVTIPPAVLAVVLVVLLALYALSWRISIALFRRREL